MKRDPTPIVFVTIMLMWAVGFGLQLNAAEPRGKPVLTLCGEQMMDSFGTPDEYSARRRAESWEKSHTGRGWCVDFWKPIQTQSGRPVDLWLVTLSR